MLVFLLVDFMVSVSIVIKLISKRIAGSGVLPLTWGGDTLDVVHLYSVRNTNYFNNLESKPSVNVWRNAPLGKM
jgi:hypothetical protein